MVSIVVPENSLIDRINAGLALRHYRKKGESPTVHLVSESNCSAFWRRLGDFADPEDKTLVIINLPLPSEDVLENMDLKPYEYAILYIPSQSVAITPKIKKLMLKKGIASMPQRVPYKCFPGEYTSAVEKRWMRIGRIASLDEENLSIDEEESTIIGGLLKRGNEDALESIKRIAADDLSFFLQAREKVSPAVQTRIERPDVNIISVGEADADIAWVALNDFLGSRKTPIGVCGETESVILTITPSFASEVIRRCDFEVKSLTRLGKGAIFFFDRPDLTLLSLCIGKLAREMISIRFDQPKHVIRKTLIRRLVGGSGPEGRTYCGIKGLDKDMIHKDIITAPQETVETVVDVLKESGSEFKFII